MLNLLPITNLSKKNYIYARVSTKRQLDDLERQINFIRSRVSKDITFISLSDVGSGINFKRKEIAQKIRASQKSIFLISFIMKVILCVLL
jgi:predicted site-specific integrase-resolvase